MRRAGACPVTSAPCPRGKPTRASRSRRGSQDWPPTPLQLQRLLRLATLGREWGKRERAGRGSTRTRRTGSAGPTHDNPRKIDQQQDDAAEGEQRADAVEPITKLSRKWLLGLVWQRVKQAAAVAPLLCLLVSARVLRDVVVQASRRHPECSCDRSAGVATCHEEWYETGCPAPASDGWRLLA